MIEGHNADQVIGDELGDWRDVEEHYLTPETNWPLFAQQLQYLRGLPRPEWFDQVPDMIAVKPIDEEAGLLWLGFRVMIFHVSIVVFTPPPMGGVLELWDYADGESACAARAFRWWPERDGLTERWVRHKWSVGVYGESGERRHVRIEDR